MSDQSNDEGYVKVKNLWTKSDQNLSENPQKWQKPSRRGKRYQKQQK